MELDINEFRERLAKVKSESGTEEEVAAFIHREILLTETLKANLMEEMNETTKEFLIEATSQIDTYRYQLQELEIEIITNYLAVDQKAALRDTKVREKIADKMEMLRELDPEKYDKEDFIDPNEAAPDNPEE